MIALRTVANGGEPSLASEYERVLVGHKVARLAVITNGARLDDLRALAHSIPPTTKLRTPTSVTFLPKELGVAVGAAAGVPADYVAQLFREKPTTWIAQDEGHPSFEVTCQRVAGMEIDHDHRYRQLTNEEVDRDERFWEAAADAAQAELVDSEIAPEELAQKWEKQARALGILATS